MHNMEGPWCLGFKMETINVNFLHPVKALCRIFLSFASRHLSAVTVLQIQDWDSLTHLRTWQLLILCTFNVHWFLILSDSTPLP